MAVRLADSTLRSGEPVTWGSGQQSMNRSWATWALFNERLRTSMQREDNPAMTTGHERITAKARCKINSEKIMDGCCGLSNIKSDTLLKQVIRYSRVNTSMRGYKLVLCCESLIEERSAGNPHATFCGNRRRVTASDDPVAVG